MSKLFILFLCLFLSVYGDEKWNKSTPLQDVLVSLGEEYPNHYKKNYKNNDSLISLGKSIFLTGNGRGNKKISKYFSCYHCHTTEQEYFSLTNRTPEERFRFSIERKTPLLPGNTIQGIVNRTSWYNGHYEETYKNHNIQEARKDLYKAIQLCAQECAKGRALDSLELESMMAYFWTKEYTLGDLSLSTEEIHALYEQRVSEKTATINYLKGKYPQSITSSKGVTPEDYVKGYGLSGDVENGKHIFTYSCLHCHGQKGLVKWPYIFGFNKHTFKIFKRYLERDHRFSIYNAIRKGSYKPNKKRKYMPLFSKETMSDQQIEDLKAYIQAFDYTKKNK